MKLLNRLNASHLLLIGKNENSVLDELTQIITQSHLFKPTRISRWESLAELPTPNRYPIFLLDWNSGKDFFDKILTLNLENTAIIIYAPLNAGRIDNETMEKINKLSNVLVVNFIGRLLNDLFVSLMLINLKKLNLRKKYPF